MLTQYKNAGPAIFILDSRGLVLYHIVMKIISILVLLSFSPAVFAGRFPPDYDFEGKYLHEGPGGLSAGWSGDEVYISWYRTKDRHGEYADGYRLYRAEDAHSVFAQLRTENEHNLIFETSYFDSPLPEPEPVEDAGITPSREFFYKVTAVVVEVLLDGEGEPTGDVILYESLFSGPVGVKRSADISCFISTAAYGSPLSEEVVRMSGFRDDYLVNCRVGKAMAGAYGSLSPPAASFLSGSSLLRALARLHLAPLAAFLKSASI